MKALRLALVLLIGVAATGCYELKKVDTEAFSREDARGRAFTILRLNRLTGEVCRQIYIDGAERNEEDSWEFIRGWGDGWDCI